MKTRKKYLRKKIQRVNKGRIAKNEINFIQKIKNISRLWFVRVLASLAVLGGIMDSIGIINLFKSKKEIFEDEKYIKGVLVPPSLNYLNEIEFRCAGFSTLYSREKLKSGIKYPIENASNIDLHFILQDNRIYTSLDFYSINNGEYIGKLDYKSWKLVKSNILDYFEGDDFFEIIDNMNNVVFSIKYEYPNVISMEGYQIYKNSIFVFNESSTYVFPLNDKQIAISEIMKIKKHSGK